MVEDDIYKQYKNHLLSQNPEIVPLNFWNTEELKLFFDY
jgi:hypothetical protein